MKILLFLLTLFIFIKTLYYGIYEIKQNNKTSGIVIIALSIIYLIVPNVLINFNINISS